MSDIIQATLASPTHPYTKMLITQYTDGAITISYSDGSSLNFKPNEPEAETFRLALSIAFPSIQDKDAAAEELSTL